MGSFTIYDEQGTHAHEGDFCKIHSKCGHLIASGEYNTYGWVGERSSVFDPLDIFSVTMMLEAGIAPAELITHKDVAAYRTKFFVDFYGNMPKVTQYLKFSGFSGRDETCKGCQSIFLD